MKKGSYKSCLKYKEIHYGNINKLINKFIFFKFNLLNNVIKVINKFSVYRRLYKSQFDVFYQAIYISRNHQFRCYYNLKFIKLLLFKKNTGSHVVCIFLVFHLKKKKD